MVKQDLISNLLRHFLYYRTYAEMKQFVDGLNAVGEFGDKVIKDYPLKLMELFVNKHQAFDFESFRDLFVINYSEPHANNKLEEDSIYCFNIFLRDTADGDTCITMTDLLQFWTGADEIPPLGFHKKLEIRRFLRRHYSYARSSYSVPVVWYCKYHEALVILICSLIS
ncbi:hypothetical protein SNE40_001003 [Patella caerulea]|uniref:Uncharacterized protein n=1 Tax=Patella caerulea TaxID=87958 RepID=A0AAN8Q7Q0_PATCE